MELSNNYSIILQNDSLFISTIFYRIKFYILTITHFHCSPYLSELNINEKDFPLFLCVF
ncbi:hypothetical protein THF5H11_30653 [Vibrio jasicida]|nr:hypothetical protein THF5H11_30653 [Vibrio jasicida]CAH1604455.1 hypothetical protein THF5G08_10344 [Vibrio jasicida]